MILISHRGNINGKNLNLENSPKYIDNALKLGYDVEIDFWVVRNKLYLGHDQPLFNVSKNWLEDRIEKLWIHCKNVDSILWCKETNFHFFWHQEDTLTLTSKLFIWVFPGKQPVKKSIAVLPELHNESYKECIGICSDFIQKYND